MAGIPGRRAHDGTSAGRAGFRSDRSGSPEVRAWLNDYRFLDKNLAAIKSAPWDLALMRQALVAASILQARPAAEMLVVMIKKLCADFFEPGIAPLPGLEPAFSDPDFTWLYEEKIHLLSPESQDARHDQQSGSAANAQQRM